MWNMVETILQYKRNNSWSWYEWATSMDGKQTLDSSLFIYFLWKIKKNRKKPLRNWLWYNVHNYGETKIKGFIKEDFFLFFIIWIDTKIYKKKKTTTETPRN